MTKSQSDGLRAENAVKLVTNENQSEREKLIMTDEKQQAIMEKVTALMAKTVENGASEAEAMQAALMAQKLMVKYGISEIRLVETDEVGSEVIDTQQIWTHILIQSIAKHYRLEAIRSTRFVNGYNQGIAVLYGHESDRKIAIEVINMLMKVIKKNATEEKKRIRKALGHCRNVEYSYAVGFIHAVVAELEKQSAALMVIVPEEVNKMFRQENPTTRAQSCNVGMVDESHYAALSMAKEKGSRDGRELMKRKELA